MTSFGNGLDISYPREFDRFLQPILGQVRDEWRYLFSVPTLKQAPTLTLSKGDVVVTNGKPAVVFFIARVQLVTKNGKKFVGISDEWEHEYVAIVQACHAVMRYYYSATFPEKKPEKKKAVEHLKLERKMIEEAKAAESASATSKLDPEEELQALLDAQEAEFVKTSRKAEAKKKAEEAAKQAVTSKRRPGQS